MNQDTKIFCIGLNKTGTTSLHKAFQLLGIKSVHFQDEKGNNIKQLIKQNHEENKPLLTGLEQYQAISDWNKPSTNHFFKYFDEQYPGSKFILHTRKLDEWLASREKHVKRNQKKANKGIQESQWVTIDKQAWKQEYHQHHRDVEQYFQHRTNDLLHIDVTAGEGWETLCPFLKKPIPNKSFPTSNRAPSMFLNRVKLLKRQLLKLFQQ